MEKMRTKSEILLFAFCFVFLLIKIYSIYTTNFNLFGDEAQYWLWSKNLDYGYFSKPPLTSWLLFVFCKIFGNSVFVIKIVSVLIYCLSSFIVFLLGKEIFRNNNIAILAAVSFYLLPSVSVSSFILSTDVLLIFFWLLSMLQIYRIRRDTNILNFIVLGIFVGLAFLSKYAALYFILCLMILIFFDREMRLIFLKKYYFLVFLITLTLVAMPNLLWNLKNGWVTFVHLSENADLGRAGINFVHGFEFIISQVLMIGPILVLSFFFLFKKTYVNDFNTKLLLIFSLPVFLIVLIESFLVRANANWAAVSLVSFMLFFFYCLIKNYKNILFLNNSLNLIFGVCFFILIANSSNLEPFKRIIGINEFSKSLSSISNQKISNLVVEDRMLFSSLSYEYRDLDFKIMTPFSGVGRIKNHFQISSPLPSKFNNSFIYLGDLNKIKYLKNSYKYTKLKTLNVGFTDQPINIYEINF